jgi:hypothetical protein
MKRRFTSRLLGALLAPWFAFVVAEPVSMHACAMHSGHRGPSSTAVAATAAPSADHAHAHGTVAQAEPAQTDAPAPSDQHPCNCMGMGCQAAAVPMPSAQVSLVDVATHRVALKVAPTSAQALATSQRDHDRPFAIGPPTQSA